jgi:hypothetical protein
VTLPRKFLRLLREQLLRQRLGDMPRGAQREGVLRTLALKELADAHYGNRAARRDLVFARGQKTTQQDDYRRAMYGRQLVRKGAA